MSPAVTSDDLLRAESNIHDLGHTLMRCALSYECPKCGLSGHYDGTIITGRIAWTTCDASRCIRYTTDEKEDQRLRLRVEEDDGIVEIVDELATFVGAKRTQPKRNGRVFMTLEETRWVHGQLSKILDRVDGGAR